MILSLFFSFSWRGSQTPRRRPSPRLVPGSLRHAVDAISAHLVRVVVPCMDCYPPSRPALLWGFVLRP